LVRGISPPAHVMPVRSPSLPIARAISPPATFTSPGLTKSDIFQPASDLPSKRLIHPSASGGPGSCAAPAAGFPSFAAAGFSVAGDFSPAAAAGFSEEAAGFSLCGGADFAHPAISTATAISAQTNPSAIVNCFMRRSLFALP
jgi:hypothetical protein